MTYIGHQSTHTPLHRDRCASVGQNLMVHASPNAEALWLICETGDAEKVGLHIRPVVAESGGKGRRRRGSKAVKGGADKEGKEKEKEKTTAETKADEEGKEEEDTSVLEYEKHLASLEEMVRAEFAVYVGCQRVGEMVLLPPRATHQVVNRHGLSAKIAWSRVTSESLGLAVERDLPLYNLLRVPEVRSRYSAFDDANKEGADISYPTNIAPCRRGSLEASPGCRYVAHLHLSLRLTHKPSQELARPSRSHHGMAPRPKHATRSNNCLYFMSVSWSRSGQSTSPVRGLLRRMVVAPACNGQHLVRLSHNAQQRNERLTVV